MNLTLDERTKIFDKVCRLVANKHFDPGMNGVDWDALARNRRGQILVCTDPEAFEKEVHKLVAELKTSHTGFRHAGMRNIPSRHAINATLQRIGVNGSERWMFQDVHRGGPAFAAGIRPGDLLIESGGREVRPPNDLTFSVGEAATLLIEKLHGEVQKINVQLPIPKSQKHPVTAPQAVTTERLSDEIGLLRVAMFPGVIGIDVAKDIDHGIAALDGCSRLIVDLRGNTGGGIGGLRLMSYLTPGKLEVGYSLTRKRRQRGYRREERTRFGRIPSHKATLIWLAARYAFVEKSILVVTEGLAQRRFHGRVVLLVNEHTASAGEMVSAFAEENDLATIVGTKTPGRLLSGSAYKVGHGYILGLPVAAYLTWQGRMLENNGIVPIVPPQIRTPTPPTKAIGIVAVCLTYQLGTLDFLNSHVVIMECVVVQDSSVQAVGWATRNGTVGTGTVLAAGRASLMRSITSFTTKRGTRNHSRGLTGFPCRRNEFRPPSCERVGATPSCLPCTEYIGR